MHRSRIGLVLIDHPESDWEKALAFWPPYADYKRRTEREIPVVVLDPVG